MTRRVFRDVQLRPETKELLGKNPQGYDLERLNKLLIEDAYPAELTPGASGWIVKDGAIASTGAGRGVLYTTGDYSHYRIAAHDAARFGQAGSSGGRSVFLHAPERRRKAARRARRNPIYDSKRLPLGLSPRPQRSGAARNSRPWQKAKSTSTNGAASKFWWTPRRERRGWPSRSRPAPRRWN